LAMLDVRPSATVLIDVRVMADLLSAQSAIKRLSSKRRRL